MYSRKRGKHGSKKPPTKVVPKWVKVKGPEVQEIIVRLAKERKTSALIGTILRDQYGIPDSRLITKKSISEVMKETSNYPQMPEDLMSLFKKAVELRDHMGHNKKDKKALVGLQHLESKIRRLCKYYSREGVIPKNFKYDPEQVKLIIQK